MNRVLPLVLGLVLLSSGRAFAQNKDKPLEVSADNFVALTWSRSQKTLRVIKGHSTQPGNLTEAFTFLNHEVSDPSIHVSGSGGESGFGYGGGSGSGAGGGFAPSYSYSFLTFEPMSNNQWKELLSQLKTLNLPLVAGDYPQKGLANGTQETLTLTLSDRADRDQSFTLSNLGNTAPASYNNFKAFLSRLIARKFPAYQSRLSETSPVTAPTTPK